MVALVRLLGHEGVPFTELHEKAKPLVEKFGRERLQEAADEITEIVGDGDAAVARLTEQASKFAVQILGAPRPSGTAPTSDAAPSLVAAQPAPSHSVAAASVPAEDVDRSQPTEAEESDSEVAAPVELEHCNWINIETQCIAQFLMRDRDFFDECRHLAAVYRACTKSSPAQTSGADDEEILPITSLLAADLERFIREYNPLGDETGPFAELLDAALGNVDWYALAESFVERDPQNGDPS